MVLAVVWWLWLTVMLQSGIVLPASTAADQADAVVESLSTGEKAPGEIPYYYRWAVFDGDGQVIGHGNMDDRRLGYAKSALGGVSRPQGIFYAQYHRIAPLPDGSVCVVQYDYSMPYGAEVLQRKLPEFQSCASVVLLLAWLAAGAVSTRHFAGLLRRDASRLTAATRAMEQRRLDVPLTGRTRVREFGETLAAMDQLRVSLARSLERQWAMEQQRELELAALTHDLKTPLTVISGNAELLREDGMEPRQHEMVDTILRSSLRLQDYVAQLRAVAGRGTAGEGKREPVCLSDLAEGWQGVGRSLCAGKQADFACSPVPSVKLTVNRDGLDRAVTNLLDNAVRYTPAGGTVSLLLRAEGKRLTISVEDDGPGFSGEALARGEQAFFTGEGSRPQEGHMGMGLYYAGRVARQHGGALRLSNTQRGARVDMTISIG